MFIGRIGTLLMAFSLIQKKRTQITTILSTFNGWINKSNYIAYTMKKIFLAIIIIISSNLKSQNTNLLNLPKYDKQWYHLDLH